MNTETREPSRLPVRGTIATVGTVGALALLLSFEGGPLASTGPVTATNEETMVAEELAVTEATTETTAQAVIEPVTAVGEAYATRWGDVQVEVTIAGSGITEVVALQMPASDDHTMMLSEYVEPILREEAIASDSATGLSVVSGATYTSEAYAGSLQSALDQARMVTSATEAEAAAEATEPEVVADEPVVEVVEAAGSEPVGDRIRTATGDAVAIRWGHVQVAVTVEGDDIIDVETLAIPTDDRKSERINSGAEPVLREEAVATDSADVSVVSGATYTSEAYATSLQSALDQLGI